MRTHTHNQHCQDRSSSHKPTTLLITTNTFETNSLSLSLSLSRSNTETLKTGILSAPRHQYRQTLGSNVQPNQYEIWRCKQNKSRSLSLSLSLSFSLSGFSAKRFAWSVSLKAAAAATGTTWSVFSSRRNLQCHKIDCSGRKGSGGYLDRLTACQRNACAKIQ